MLIAGMSAWLFRYIMFAYGNAGPYIWMLWLGTSCTVSATTSSSSPTRSTLIAKPRHPLRATAQGLITFLTYGAGMFVGSWLSRAVIQHFTLGEGQHNWRAIWIFSACASVLALLALSFRDTERESLTSTEPAILPAHSPF